MQKTVAYMIYMGYTREEIEIAGEYAFDYQGVGNPHRYAKIKPGEKVLDIGSGLGVDSFIAYHYTKKKGRVIGLDNDEKMVKNA